MISWPRALPGCGSGSTSQSDNLGPTSGTVVPDCDGDGDGDGEGEGVASVDDAAEAAASSSLPNEYSVTNSSFTCTVGP